MKTRIKAMLLATILVCTLLFVGLAQADTGPKPTMDFQFQFESGVEEAIILSGTLFECNEPNCSDAAPLEDLGPQGLYCETTSCNAIGYGFDPYLILEIEFSDGITRRSNIFEETGFDSFYTVYVRPQDLFVEPRFSAEAIPVWTWALTACICVLAAVGLTAGAVVLLRRRARQ